MTETIIFPVLVPIQKRGRTYDKKSQNFRKAYNRSGVYIIFKQTQSGLETMYVGSGKDAGRQCARKFYPYRDAFRKEDGMLFNAEYRQRVTFSDEKKSAKFFVKFFLYGNTKDINRETRTKIYNKEYSLIEQLKPKYNTNSTGDPEDENLEKQAELQEQTEEAIEKYEDYKEDYREYLKQEQQQSAAQDTDFPEPKEPNY